jgi:hypothetical protein
VVTDINQDNWPDLYVTNDFIYDDHLWINNRNGTFTDQSKQYFRHTSRFAMGTDAADINNDGLVDLFSLDMLPDDNRRQKLMNMGMNYDLFNLSLERGYLPQYSRNTLQLNNGEGNFSEIGYLAGVYKTDWSWCALLADFDNDGHRDLFISNGIPKDITDSDYIMYRDEQVQAPGFNYAETKKTIFRLVDQLPEVKKHDFVFRNNGNLTFSDQSAGWGLTDPAFSNGAAYADLDRDGDLDLVINRLNQTAGLYQNQASQQLKNHFLDVRLTGYPVPEAKVALWTGGQGQVAESGTVRGFQSAVENSLHFGLGKAVVADSLTVVWPDGKKQTLTQVPADRTLVLDYRQATRPKNTKAVTPVPIFAEVTGQNGIKYEHKENPFVDFKMEPLLPHQFSRNGPGIAVADVNGDGLDDFCIGGAAKAPGKVFIQTPSGKFTAKDLPDPDFEDMGLLLFDADGDRDVDLYVVSGGSEFNAGSAPYQDRLYLNDGKGNFTRNAAALPAIRSSGSCVTAADYDRDGDLDLFVGGRVLPGRYPIPAQSYLLRNDEEKFTDITATVAPGLGQIGLVTAALWTDYDGNGQADLMLAGEWMAPTLFRNENGHFVNVTATTGLAAATGWWNSLTGDDFDGDGDTDYIAGNLGLNTPYHARPGQPVAVHAADFDGNGTLDPVLSYFLGGLSVPVATRDALAVQVPMMRRRFPKYSDYAAASLEQVLTPEERQNAYQAKSEYLPSSYIENKGNGVFTIRPLPVEAQFAPIFGMLTGDYDHDGHADVLLSGNSFAPEYVAGWYDAGSGLYLRGDGKGNFTAVPASKSGYRVTGDAKGMASLFTASGQQLICTGQNNSILSTYLVTGRQTQPMADVLPMDAWAEITRTDGRKTRKEFYYGSGYLGQSSRRLLLSVDASAIRIYDTSGKVREESVGQLSGRVH